MDQVTVRLHFKNAPWEEADVEAWSFTMEPDGDGRLEVDVDALENDLKDAVGPTSTLIGSVNKSWGGWGAEGLTVVEIVFTLAANLATAALWDAVKQAYKRRTNIEPKTEKTQAEPVEESPEEKPNDP